MLVTDVQQERSLTRITDLAAADPGALDRRYHDMEEAAVADLVRENIPRDSLKTLRFAGMRYAGQSYEVSVPVGPLRQAQDLQDLARRFHDTHHRRYGHMAKGQAVEIVNFQVTAVGTIPKPEMKKFPRGAGRLPTAAATRQVHFGASAPVATPVYHRSLFTPGMEIAGPAIIEEKTSTTVLYPGQVSCIDEYLNMEIA
jgi:N-methylhydantoinase A